MTVPFSPNVTNTAALSVTATTGRQAITLNGAPQVELTNTGSKWCYVAFGDATVTASVPSGAAGSYPIGPGQSKIVTVDTSITNVAAIADSGNTTTLLATPGRGDS